MEKGEVRFSGPTAELLERKDIVRSVFLEGAASFGGKGATVGANTSPSRSRRAAHAAMEDEPSLRVTGLHKSFGGICAVKDVGFELRRHEILGLIGPNGAGKTTIFDLISGLLKPDGGQIWLGAEQITSWGADRRARDWADPSRAPAWFPA